MSTMSLGCCLDLDFIARRAWNVEYKPNKVLKPESGSRKRILNLLTEVVYSTL